MSPWTFGPHEMRVMGEALDIAEDLTGDYFKLSTPQWQRHPYEVRTQARLGRWHLREGIFAFLEKGTRHASGEEPRWKRRERYFICLQDREILKALRRDPHLSLLPLMVYVFTHELVHIVRFARFLQRFEAEGEEKAREEGIVHATSYEILRGLCIPKMDHVLGSYEGQRLCEGAGMPSTRYLA